MFFRTIPRDLQELIVKFAYGARISKPLQEDLEMVIEHQQAIPEHFLEDRFKPHRYQPFPLWPMNPFKKGNPYFPTDCLDRFYSPWTPFVCFAICHISKDGARNMRSYQGHIRNQCRQFMKSSVPMWNHFCLSLFSREGLLLSENYELEDPYLADFLDLFIQQVLGAKFVSQPWSFSAPSVTYQPYAYHALAYSGF